MSRNIVKEGVKKLGRLIKKDKFPILEGHPIAQQHGQEAVKSVGNLKNAMKLADKAKKKEFRIYRWSPDYPNQKPFLQSFFVDLPSCGPMVCALIWEYIAIAIFLLCQFYYIIVLSQLETRYNFLVAVK